MENKIKRDCFYFKGDRPCIYHKADSSLVCKKCQYYKKVKYNFLIIKLGSVGDVLRTTCILRNLKEVYDDYCKITWITRSESVPLFYNNNFVDRVIDYESTFCISDLVTSKYDIVFNFDSSADSCQLASIAKSRKKVGFCYDRSRIISSDPVKEWFYMGLNDIIKKKNEKTYQRFITETSGFDDVKELTLFLSSEERKEAIRFMEKNSIPYSNVIVGMNISAGRRWKQKKWNIADFESLIKLINENCKNSSVIIYGGKDDKDAMTYLSEKCNVINSGINNLRTFISLLSLCDVLVTGDTLALHIATALEKHVIALFGPTSYSEVELYDRGVKLYPDIDCLMCYLNDCDKNPNCMDLIKAEVVFNEINNYIKNYTQSRDGQYSSNDDKE